MPRVGFGAAACPARHAPAHSSDATSRPIWRRALTAPAAPQLMSFKNSRRAVVTICLLLSTHPEKAET